MQMPRYLKEISDEGISISRRATLAFLAACGCRGTKRAVARVFEQIYNPASERASELAEGVVWE